MYKRQITGRGIFDCMIDCLLSYGLTGSFLRNNLISLTCGAAAVMIGNEKGVGTLFRDKFPPLIVWHCANPVSYTHLDVYKRQDRLRGKGSLPETFFVVT